MVVLDSSAIIALLKGEPGSEIVANHLSDAAISAVNVQEIAKKMLEAGMPEAVVRQTLDELRLTVMPHGNDDALQAASLFAATRKIGSGLGDRSCMALAIRLRAPALTTDRAWAKLDIAGLEVVLVR